jgi:NSS family neurotransmitter:Na+ symporter
MGIIGNFFAIIFFIALAFAGLTSSVSLVEPMVKYFVERFQWSIQKASIMMGLFFYLIGIIALLSNIDSFKEYLSWGGKNFFDWIDYITAGIMLPLGGLIMAIFVGFIIEKEKVYNLMKPQLGFFFDIWYFSLRYITPLAMFIVMLNVIGIF